MDLICYACSQPATVRRSKIVSVDAAYVEKCWGSCPVCSIVVCTEHGFRNTNPVEYECVYCVAPGFTKRAGIQPETMESFLESYEGLRASILAAIREAITTYQRENYLGYDSFLDEGAYRAAALAFEIATGAEAG